MLFYPDSLGVARVPLHTAPHCSLAGLAARKPLQNALHSRFVGRLHGQPLPKRRSVSTTLRLVWGITPFATRPHTAPCGAPLPAVFGIPQPVHLASALPALGRCLLRRVGYPPQTTKRWLCGVWRVCLPTRRFVCVQCGFCWLAHARARCSMRGVIVFFTTPRPPQGGGATRVKRAAKSLRFILHS